MPCQDALADAEDAAEREKRIDQLAQNLCFLCHHTDMKQLKKRVKKGDMPKLDQLLEWWDAHQEFDRVRLAEEAAAAKKAGLRAKAYSKLSKAEREALGIF